MSSSSWNARNTLLTVPLQDSQAHWVHSCSVASLHTHAEFEATMNYLIYIQQTIFQLLDVSNSLLHTELLVRTADMHVQFLFPLSPHKVTWYVAVQLLKVTLSLLAKCIYDSIFGLYIASISFIIHITFINTDFQAANTI